MVIKKLKFTYFFLLFLFFYNFVICVFLDSSFDIFIESSNNKVREMIEKKVTKKKQNIIY